MIFAKTIGLTKIKPVKMTKPDNIRFFYAKKLKFNFYIYLQKTSTMDKSKLSKLSKISKKLKAINLLGGKCKMCDESNIFKLSFHHINPNEKELTINKLKSSRWSLIEKELTKCELLCNNCHMEHHHPDSESRHKNNKKIYLEIKGIFNCEMCGYEKSKSALHFHHTGDKKFQISKLNREIRNIIDVENSIIDEINNCQILCSNCHSYIHSDVEFYKENMNEIIRRSKNIREISPKLDRELVKKMFYVDKIRRVDIAKKLNVTKGAITLIIQKLEDKEGI